MPSFGGSLLLHSGTIDLSSHHRSTWTILCLPIPWHDWVQPVIVSGLLLLQPSQFTTLWCSNCANRFLLSPIAHSPIYIHRRTSIRCTCHGAFDNRNLRNTISGQFLDGSFLYPRRQCRPRHPWHMIQLGNLRQGEQILHFQWQGERLPPRLPQLQIHNRSQVQRNMSTLKLPAPVV